MLQTVVTCNYLSGLFNVEQAGDEVELVTEGLLILTLNYAKGRKWQSVA